jgi:3-carboxy-cis,cis-muconate cycloisomerase
LLAAEGVALALGEHLGKQQAHHMLEVACREAIAQHRHLRDVLAERPEVRAHLDQRRLDALFDPSRALGVAPEWIERVAGTSRPTTSTS